MASLDPLPRIHNRLPAFVSSARVISRSVSILTSPSGPRCSVLTLQLSQPGLMAEGHPLLTYADRDMQLWIHGIYFMVLVQPNKCILLLGHSSEKQSGICTFEKNIAVGRWYFHCVQTTIKTQYNILYSMSNNIYREGIAIQLCVFFKKVLLYTYFVPWTF